MQTVRDEFEAFLKRWQSVEVRLRPGAAQIPPQVFEPGSAALARCQGNKAGEAERAAAHALALRAWVRKEFGTWGQAWAARLDDRELWRRLNDAPAQWFADADETLRRIAGDKAERMFLDEFAPLAARALRMPGDAEAATALADPPEPPAAVEPARLARELCGAETNDTRDAGRRVLAWAAMAAAPTAFHRPAGFARSVGRWARSLVVPLAAGHGYRLLGQPLVWARDEVEAEAGRADAVGRAPTAAAAGDRRQAFLSMVYR